MPTFVLVTVEFSVTCSHNIPNIYPVARCRKPDVDWLDLKNKRKGKNIDSCNKIQRSD